MIPKRVSPLSTNVVNDKTSIYQTPTSSSLEIESLNADELRKQFAYDEVCILAVGWFYYYLGSLLLGLTGLAAWIYFILDLKPFILSTFICLLAGILYIIIGYGLRNFDTWARIPSIVAGYTAMFLFPVGTLAGGVCIYLLHGHAIQEIFSNEYRTAYSIACKKLPRFGWLGITLGLLTGSTITLLVYLLRHRLGLV